MKQLSILLLNLLLGSNSFAQINTFEKDLQSNDRAFISIASNGELFISSSIKVSCYDSLGSSLWNYTWPSNGNYFDSHVADLNDGNVAVFRQGSQYTTEVVGVKKGVELWKKEFVGHPNSMNYPKGALFDDGFLYIISSSEERGSSNNLSPILIKLASNGDSIFVKDFPNSLAGEMPLDLFMSEDTLIVFTRTFNPIINNYLVKITKDGDFISRTFISDAEYISDLVQTSDNCFVFLSSPAGLTEDKLTKINKSGVKIWKKSLGLNGLTKLAASSDGGFAFLLNRKNENGWLNLILIKTNQEGIIVREQKLDGRYDNNYKDIIGWPQGGFIVIGSFQLNEYYNSTTNYLYKTDLEGNVGSPLSFTTKYNGIPYGEHLAFGDYDGDNDPDVYFKGKLYENKDGEMSEVFPNDITNSTHDYNYYPVEYGAWGDIDNRNGIDLYIPHIEELYMNKGSKRFRWDSLIYNSTDKPNSFGATWIDFNNDGYLDLLLNVGSPETLSLFENQGNNTFKVSSAINFPVGKRIESCQWVDYDYDADLDLFIIATYNSNSFDYYKYAYKNEGNGVFSDVSSSFDLYKKEPRLRTISWAYLNNDQFLDAISNDGDVVSFYFNNSKGVFEKDTSFYFGNVYGLNISDVDNDGDQDLFISSAHASGLYINYGMNRFAIRADFAGTTNDPIDLDGDGDLDYLNPSHSASSLNNGNSNKWIKIKLRGEKSNALGIGAQIFVKTINNGSEKWTCKQVTSAVIGVNLTSPVHFGLGNADAMDSVIVVWPSGCKQYIKNASFNSVVEVKENCFAKSPNPVDTLLCNSDNIEINASPGVNFKWYSSLSSEVPFFIGSPIKMNGILKDTLLFVANADSSIESRRSPVVIKRSDFPKAQFEFTVEKVNGYNLYKFQDLSTHADTRSWYLNKWSYSSLKNVEIARYDNQSFVVKLIVESECGMDSLIRSVGLNTGNSLASIDIIGNPINENSYFSLELKETSDLELYIVNGLGGRVPLIDKLQLPLGSHNLNLYDLGVLKLKSGIYTCLFTINGKSYPVKIFKP